MVSPSFAIAGRKGQVQSPTGWRILLLNPDVLAPIGVGLPDAGWPGNWRLRLNPYPAPTCYRGGS